MYPMGFYDYGYGLGYGMSQMVPPPAVVNHQADENIYVAHHESNDGATIALLSFAAIGSLAGLLIARKANKATKLVDAVTHDLRETAKKGADEILEAGKKVAEEAARKIESDARIVAGGIKGEAHSMRRAAAEDVKTAEGLKRHWEEKVHELVELDASREKEIADLRSRIEELSRPASASTPAPAAPVTRPMDVPSGGAGSAHSTTRPGTPPLKTEAELKAEAEAAKELADKKAAEKAEAEAAKLAEEGETKFKDGMNALKGGKKEPGVELLKDAAAKGNVDARIRIAEFMADGEHGVTKDAKKAFEEFQELVKSHPENSRAWSGLAVSYDRGEVVIKNQKAAYNCFTHAVELDDRNKTAHFYLAKYHKEGLGGAEKSLDKAIEHLEKAHPTPDVVYDLGRCYQNRADEIVQSALGNQNVRASANRYYRNAIQTYERLGGKNPYALYHLGYLKEQVKGCTVETINIHKSAFGQLLGLAEKGDPEATQCVIDLNEKFRTIMSNPQADAKLRDALVNDKNFNVLLEKSQQIVESAPTIQKTPVPNVDGGSTPVGGDARRIVTAPVKLDGITIPLRKGSAAGTPAGAMGEPSTLVSNSTEKLVAEEMGTGSKPAPKPVVNQPAPKGFFGKLANIVVQVRSGELKAEGLSAIIQGKLAKLGGRSTVQPAAAHSALGKDTVNIRVAEAATAKAGTDAASGAELPKPFMADEGAGTLPTATEVAADGGNVVSSAANSRTMEIPSDEIIDLPTAVQPGEAVVAAEEATYKSAQTLIENASANVPFPAKIDPKALLPDVRLEFETADGGMIIFCPDTIRKGEYRYSRYRAPLSAGEKPVLEYSVIYDNNGNFLRGKKFQEGCLMPLDVRPAETINLNPAEAVQTPVVQPPVAEVSAAPTGQELSQTLRIETSPTVLAEEQATNITIVPESGEMASLIAKSRGTNPAVAVVEPEAAHVAEATTPQAAQAAHTANESIFADLTKSEEAVVADLVEAAKGGNVDAMRELGHRYRYETEATTESRAQAFAWYEKAAKAGDVESMYELARCHMGRDEYPYANPWLEQAANLGHVKAATGLGFSYERGLGVWKNVETAARWYKKAADAGDTDAAKRLADIVEFYPNVGLHLGITPRAGEAAPQVAHAAEEAAPQVTQAAHAAEEAVAKNQRIQDAQNLFAEGKLDAGFAKLDEAVKAGDSNARENLYYYSKNIILDPGFEADVKEPYLKRAIDSIIDIAQNGAEGFKEEAAQLLQQVYEFRTLGDVHIPDDLYDKVLKAIAASKGVAVK